MRQREHQLQHKPHCSSCSGGRGSGSSSWSAFNSVYTAITYMPQSSAVCNSSSSSNAFAAARGIRIFGRCIMCQRTFGVCVVFTQPLCGSIINLNLLLPYDKYRHCHGIVEHHAGMAKGCHALDMLSFTGRVQPCPCSTAFCTNDANSSG